MLVAAALVAALLAVAATGDALRQGARNGTAVKETRIVGDVDATPTGRGGFVLRESNVATGRDAGGASFMSCNAPRGGTAKGSAPCLRTDNLARGLVIDGSTDPSGVLDEANSRLADFAFEPGETETLALTARWFPSSSGTRSLRCGAASRSFRTARTTSSR